MAVGAEAGEEEVDAAGGFDFLLKFNTLGLEVVLVKIKTGGVNRVTNFEV